VAKYSSHYNKVLNKVTHNRKMGLTRGAPKEELGTGSRTANNLSKSSLGSAGRSAFPDESSQSAGSSFPTAHLTVRQYDLDSSLAWTMQDYPKNEESDTILVVVATNPHLSIIVDKPVKLLAGTELFTFILGPKVTVRAVDDAQLYLSHIARMYGLVAFIGVEALGEGHSVRSEQQLQAGADRAARVSVAAARQIQWSAATTQRVAYHASRADPEDPGRGAGRRCDHWLSHQGADRARH